jgi:hypothetical protein
MSVELFRDSDQDCAAWLAANAQGYVLNIQRSLNPSDARMHSAACRTIAGTPRGNTRTRDYVKACSASLVDISAHERGAEISTISTSRHDQVSLPLRAQHRRERRRGASIHELKNALQFAKTPRSASVGSARGQVLGVSD